MLRVRIDGASVSARPVWNADGVALRALGTAVSAAATHFENGQLDANGTLASLARELGSRAGRLECCGGCARFGFSGMSFDMTGGRRGYCGLVGSRSRRGVVDIDHACGEFEELEAWPDDAAAVHEARLELRMREPRPSRRAAFRGAMLGLGVGDALGFPSEFRSRGDCVRAFGERGVRELVSSADSRWPDGGRAGSAHPAGTYSDDTQMTLAVAQALLEASDQDEDALMRAMARRFVTWSRSPENDRAPGRTCMEACSRLGDGLPWREAGIAGSKGCGSAMRVAPIGLRWWRDEEQLLEVARASSLLTHGHETAVESAAAAALLVKLALEKRTPEQMHRALVERCAPRAPELAKALRKLEELRDAEPEHALSEDGLGLSWVAEEAVVSALYCFWRSPLDFEETVSTAATTDGDSDSIACIAGGISGAFNGVDAIPARWREGVENGPGLIEVADRLCAAAEG